MNSDEIGRGVRAARGMRIHHPFTPEEMRPEWLAYLCGYHDEFVVPTSVLLTSWEPPRPKAGRIFVTDLIVRGPLVWTRERYMKHRRALGENECERAPGDEEVALAEYWADESDDSRSYYCLAGWMFIDRSALKREE